MSLNIALDGERLATLAACLGFRAYAGDLRTTVHIPVAWEDTYFACAVSAALCHAVWIDVGHLPWSVGRGQTWWEPLFWPGAPGRLLGDARFDVGPFSARDLKNVAKWNTWLCNRCNIPMDEHAAAVLSLCS